MERLGTSMELLTGDVAGVGDMCGAGREHVGFGDCSDSLVVCRAVLYYCIVTYLTVCFDMNPSIVYFSGSAHNGGVVFKCPLCRRVCCVSGGGDVSASLRC